MYSLVVVICTALTPAGCSGAKLAATISASPMVQSACIAKATKYAQNVPAPAGYSVLYRCDRSFAA